MNNKLTVFITGVQEKELVPKRLFFAKQGYRVEATDISEKNLITLKKKLGEDHFYRRLDVTQTDEHASMLSDFASESGDAIDVLFNNAGIAFIDDFEKVPLEKHLAITDVNVKGIQIGAFHAHHYPLS